MTQLSDQRPSSRLRARTTTSSHSPLTYELPGTTSRTRLSSDLDRYRCYPLYYPPLSWLEKLMVKTKFGGVGKCLLCGAFTHWRIHTDNLRETGACRRCESTSRFRSLVYVLCRSLSVSLGLRIETLRDLAQVKGLVVYNTEAHSSLHRILAPMEGYLCSEYRGDDYQGGEIIDGVQHQDLQNLSLPDESVDVVLSTDVFEHIPDPYKAHREVFRILKRGGRHIFTVPFDQAQFLDDYRAAIEEDGSLNFLKPPVYHHDPIRDEGCLVYSFFSIEMLARLRRLGFRTNMYRLHRRWNGMIGNNGLVFEAVKWDPPSELPSQEWFQGEAGTPS